MYGITKLSGELLCDYYAMRFGCDTRGLRLPEDLDYARVDGLSNEARQRLQLARPATLGQASRLEGMTPSAVSLLLIHIKKRQLLRSA